jgi:hypothetical protein
MRVTPVLGAPLLLLAGCNLFRSGRIGQTCEDLPGGCDGPDSEPPDDTVDSAPYVPEPDSSLGVALASLSGGTLWVRALDAAGAVLQEASATVPDTWRAGPVAFDAENGRLLTFDNGSMELWTFDASGAESRMPLAEDVTGVGTVYDMALVDGALFLVTDTVLWRLQPDAGAIEAFLAASGFRYVRGVFPASDDNLYVLDLGGDGQPDLFRVTISTVESRLSFEDYDDGQGRTGRGFRGVDNEPFVCSGVGAVYQVSVLQGGDRYPAAFANQDELADLYEGAIYAEETTDCAWDPVTGRFALHSARLGVLAVDAWGHVLPLYRPEGDEQPLRGSFFSIPEPLGD